MKYKSLSIIVFIERRLKLLWSNLVRTVCHELLVFRGRHLTSKLVTSSEESFIMLLARTRKCFFGNYCLTRLFLSLLNRRAVFFTYMAFVF